MADRPDKLTVCDPAWQKAVAREAVIRPLISATRISRGDITSACRQLGLKRTRLYELVAKFRKRPVTSSLLDEMPGPEKGRRLLSADQEDVVRLAIEAVYCARERPTISAVHDHVLRACRQRDLHPPSWKAVKARVDQSDQRRLMKLREGAKAARQQFAAVVGEYSAQYALQVVQIDHTLVDLFIVDTVSRQPLQRPWLTLAIDVASRMVAGFYLSLENPSSTSVALAVQHVVLPKESWLASRGIEAEWPVFGLPDVIHLDNGREFHGKALVRGAAEHGVELQYRPVARPHFGGIERLIGTMMGAVHLLPGSTSSDIGSRGDYDPQRHAIMTLDELEQWLALQIVGRYHANIHRALRLPPNTAWQDAVAARPLPRRLPYDEHRFLLDFLPFEERNVRRDGVHLFGLKYWDDVLSPLAGGPCKMRVRYDPRDLSTVYGEAPDGSTWPIRFANLGWPRITLGEHRQALALLRQRGVRSVDADLIFKTIDGQRRIVEMSGQQTRSVRRNAEKRSWALAWEGHSSVPARDSGDDQHFVELPPLSVDEWS
ncbi:MULTISPECIES: Mu transposase C-terminal domain-containing protein [Rhizobium]|uniref:Putative transposase n=1 Tax=Rhizobium paranaense TaxID=1650438 RepID=A0A7W9D4X6_9HYPH|nr:MULTISPECIES: Mu transposase C-terminal domain-containing protein [Rhizobium]MBB5577848.1 putative transposase [Rhizobium paranaense]PST64680.1 transposase [Rhizobium sp. SEMIA4064]